MPMPIDEPQLKEFHEALAAFREANDANQKRYDLLNQSTMAKASEVLDRYEAVNQKITTMAKAQAALQEQLDEVDKLFRRPGVMGKRDNRAAYKAMVNDWGRGVITAVNLGLPNLPEGQRAAMERVASYYAGLRVSDDSSGGYLAPPELVQEIIKGETEISPVRSLVRVRNTTRRNMETPKRTGQFAAQWVSENGTRSETTGLGYGMWDIPTHELFALVDISSQMLEDTAFDLEAEIREEAVEQFSLAEGTAVVTGNGVGKPEGFMTNASVATTNSGAATAVTADGLLTLTHAIKSAYARNGTFVMNRTTLGAVRKLKDGTGGYLWMPGIAMGRPNTIDGAPYVELPDMPNEGAGAKPVAFGDFRRAYTLVDRVVMSMLRDPFTQATSGNVRYLFRRRLGGQLLLPEALRTLTCAA